MSTTPQNVLQLARQGNPDAIAALMNRHLEAQGITAQVVQQESTLHVRLESAQVPHQADLVAYVKKGITGLELAAIDHLTVSAKQLGTDSEAWSEKLMLQPLPTVAEVPSDLGLDFDFDSATPEVESLSDLDLEAALDTGLDAADLDFDLGLTDSASDFDLGLTDSASDLDLDLGLTAPNADLGTAAETDFDLGFFDSPATEEALEFDLGLPDGTDSAEPAPDLDFDLDLTSAPVETSAATDLDFDLGLIDEPMNSSAAADLDFGLGLTDELATDTDGLDFDLDFANDPTMVTSPGDLDFDLGVTHEATEPAAEFDFGLADEPGDTTAASGLDFDLGGDESLADLDLGFVNGPREAISDSGLDFDLGGDESTADLDLGFEGEAMALDFAPDDLSLDSGPDAGSVDFDLGLEDTSDFDLGLDDTGGADVTLDLTTPAPSPSATAVAALDDLWGSEEAGSEAPDLGFTPSDLATDGTPDAWTADTDFPALDDMVAAEEDLAEPGEVPPLEALSPDLLAPEDLAFEDLGAAVDLESENPVDDWAVTPDLALTDDDLGGYAPLTTDDAEAGLDWTATDFVPVDSGTDDLSTDDLTDFPSPEGFGADEALAADADLDLDWSADKGLTDLESTDLSFTSSEPPQWGETEGDFDSGLESPAAFGDELDGGFDPGLVFDAAGAEAAVDTPNPFEAEAFSLEDTTDYTADTFEPGLGESGPAVFAAEAEFPFDSTMELDQTVGGDFIPQDLSEESAPIAFDDAYSDITPEPSETSVDEAVLAALGFDDVSDEDLAFESVEISADEIVAPPFEAEGLGTEGLGDEGFGDEGFGDEGFDTDLFSDSAGDSNGFIQDRNGVVLTGDEPDAADDFIQEFGTDPSTHVSLTPDQFAADGSVRRPGSSGLPLRLILGLGLGALALALAGLLLHGLLGRLRQPAPGGEPAVTEPAPVEPPVNPATVAEDDLFRQAVNAAQTAANQAQTAQTAAQWQAVADSWASAIALMQRVPESDPNYAVAQQKAVQYQPNLAYAQQNVQRLK